MATSQLIPITDGGYACLKGGFPYSQGVAALDGYAIERVRFREPVPLMHGFAAIEAHLAALSRPRTALCAAELRSPKPFTMEGFSEFNRGYVEVLKQWGIFREGLNPVARSNVAPEIAPPSEPSFYAFCYTVPAESGERSFVVAGSGELPEGGRFPDDIVARGDVSAHGMRPKARMVMDTMHRRLTALGGTWSEVSAVQIYTVHDIQSFLGDEIIRHAGNGAGFTWHLCRPPIEELEFEMDMRGVAVERVISVQASGREAI